jgi:hypothetical protein
MIGRTLFAVGAAIASLASTAYGTPIGAVELSKRANIDDTILQFALTLEHLENVFYKQVLVNFTVNDFIAAGNVTCTQYSRVSTLTKYVGYTADYYNNLKYIAYDEQVHVQTLSAALQADGVTPNKACTYSFPYTDVYVFPVIRFVVSVL